MSSLCRTSPRRFPPSSLAPCGTCCTSASATPTCTPASRRARLPSPWLFLPRLLQAQAPDLQSIGPVGLLPWCPAMECTGRTATARCHVHAQLLTVPRLGRTRNPGTAPWTASPTPPLPPCLQADVMKPLNIEHLMDNEVQTLSGGEESPTPGRRTRSAAQSGCTKGRHAPACPLMALSSPARQRSAWLVGAPWAKDGAPPLLACRTRPAHSTSDSRPSAPPPAPAPAAGELQRVAICLCLGQPANVYLIDEPSAYLDSEQRILAAKVIKR